MKYYDFNTSLVLDEQGEWDYGKMTEHLWNLSNAFVPAFGGQNIYPFTRGKAEDFAKENGLYKKGTAPILATVEVLISEEGKRLWQNHLQHPYGGADEYIRMDCDWDYPGQFIIEMQTRHLYVANKEVTYKRRSENARLYIKYRCIGFDIHFSDRRC